jgi:hypothetical protein
MALEMRLFSFLYDFALPVPLPRMGFGSSSILMTSSSEISSSVKVFLAFPFPFDLVFSWLRTADREDEATDDSRFVTGGGITPIGNGATNCDSEHSGQHQSPGGCSSSSKQGMCQPAKHEYSFRSKADSHLCRKSHRTEFLPVTLVRETSFQTKVKLTSSPFLPQISQFLHSMHFHG